MWFAFSRSLLKCSDSRCEEAVATHTAVRIQISASRQGKVLAVDTEHVNQPSWTLGCSGLDKLKCKTVVRAQLISKPSGSRLSNRSSHQHVKGRYRCNGQSIPHAPECVADNKTPKDEAG